LIHQVRFGQFYPRHVAADCLPRHIEELFGEIESLVTEARVPFQNVAGHVSRPEARFEYMGVREPGCRDALQYQVEQSKARRRRDEAIGPALDKCCVVKLVLGTDKPAHIFFSSAIAAKAVSCGMARPPKTGGTFRSA